MRKRSEKLRVVSKILLIVYQHIFRPQLTWCCISYVTATYSLLGLVKVIIRIASSGLAAYVKKRPNNLKLLLNICLIP